MVGRSKIKRRTSDILNIFLLHLQFLVKFNKIAALLGNEQTTPDLFGDTVG
jgi:hypothetical protein